MLPTIWNAVLYCCHCDHEFLCLLGVKSTCRFPVAHPTGFSYSLISDGTSLSGNQSKSITFKTKQHCLLNVKGDGYPSTFSVKLCASLFFFLFNFHSLRHNEGHVADIYIWIWLDLKLVLNVMPLLIVNMLPKSASNVSFFPFSNCSNPIRF